MPFDQVNLSTGVLTSSLLTYKEANRAVAPPSLKNRSDAYAGR